MPFNVFKARGGGIGDSSVYFPFQAIVQPAKSGVDAGNFNTKCPCDDGSVNYTSNYFFSSAYPKISSSGDLSVSIYSGSMLYSQYSFNGVGATGIKSYVGDKPENFTSIDCEKEKNLPVMRVYGLNKPIFLNSWFANVPGNLGSNRTLKIWLSVCFPTGVEDSNQNTFANQNNTCYSCSERANVPLIAFISCGVTDWPEVVKYKLIDKGSTNRPRLEKRQIAANIPIAEIDYKGNVIKQYVNSNLMLQDMCLGGIPSKMPISVFSEYG